MLIKAPETVSAKYKPVIFLAGPIIGAPDWQVEAFNIIHELNASVLVASPRRSVIKDKLTPEDFEAQVTWESIWLSRAAITGCILFWLAKETDHKCSRAYAQTTRFELGEWLSRGNNAQIVVGIEPGFTGESYIRARLKLWKSPVQVVSTLKEACVIAVDYC